MKAEEALARVLVRVREHCQRQQMTRIVPSGQL